MMEGETASPKAWMKKMFSAKAMARIDGSVTLIMTVLRGPVLRNRKNSATKMAHRQPVRVGAMIAQTAKGVPIRKPHPETSRYPLLVLFCHRSPSQPPAIVPQIPATTVIAPNRVLPRDTSRECTRWRNEGSHWARPPKAKVMAAMANVLQTKERFLMNVP